MINYKRLAEIVKPYGLSVNCGRIECGCGVWLDFTTYDRDIIIRAIKQNDLENLNGNNYPSVKTLITILHPHFDEIFEMEIDKNKLIELLKENFDCEVQGDSLWIKFNNGKYHYEERLDVRRLIRSYKSGERRNKSENIILSFMDKHEDEFTRWSLY